jgi:hypothetical protein
MASQNETHTGSIEFLVLVLTATAHRDCGITSHHSGAMLTVWCKEWWLPLPKQGLAKRLAPSELGPQKKGPLGRDSFHNIMA